MFTIVQRTTLAMLVVALSAVAVQGRDPSLEVFVDNALTPGALVIGQGAQRLFYDKTIPIAPGGRRFHHQIRALRVNVCVDLVVDASASADPDGDVLFFTFTCDRAAMA